MWTVLFGLISGIPGLATKFLDWQVQKANVTLDGFKTAAGIDLGAYQTYMSAMVELNRMKLAQNSWFGAKLIIMIAGVPAAMHFAGIMLDSTPFLYFTWSDGFAQHVVGSWRIPKPPAPYDVYEWAIVQSFFLVMPAMPLVSAVSQWLTSKR